MLAIPVRQACFTNELSTDEYVAPMLRLLIDLGNASSWTGTGVAARGLIGALQRYSANDITVTEAGISRFAKRLRLLHRIAYLSRLRLLSMKGYDGSDVVHFTNVYCPQRHNNVATVTTVHDLDAVQHPEVYSRWYSAYYARTVRNTVKRSDVVITDTEAVRNMILNRYNLSCDRVVATGIGLNPLFTAAIDSGSQVTHRSYPILLYIGSLQKKKNITWLIRAVVTGVKSGALPKLRLVLAGNRGFGFGEIAAAMQSAGGLVTWIANPDINRIAELYFSSSMLVLPSHCEGFGIPLLEAMYCRKPIVASRIPTNLEVASGVAYFFSLENADEFYHAVQSALDQVDAEERLTAASRRLQYYSWENLASMHTRVYKSLIVS